MQRQNTDHLTRQLDLIPLRALATPVTIVGAGAIGSFTALALAKMGFSNLEVFDFDEVSIENMNSQFYRFSDIGKKKVQALHDLVKDFTGVEIRGFDMRFPGGHRAGLVLACVDSMSARREIWNSQDGAAACAAFVDPRMGAETALLYVARPNVSSDREAYEATLYSDRSAVQERCTAKATMYTATMLSGLVAKAVKDLACGIPYPKMAQWDIAGNDFIAWKGGEVQS